MLIFEWYFNKIVQCFVTTLKHSWFFYVAQKFIMLHRGFLNVAQKFFMLQNGYKFRKCYIFLTFYLFAIFAMFK